jgi:hypothetical protein
MSHISTNIPSLSSMNDAVLALNKFGITLLQQGKYRDAKATLHDALQIIRSVLGNLDIQSNRPSAFESNEHAASSMPTSILNKEKVEEQVRAALIRMQSDQKDSNYEPNSNNVGGRGKVHLEVISCSSFCKKTRHQMQSKA